MSDMAGEEDHPACSTLNVDRRQPMGVPCSGCGREYDITLFEFGRTIHCTCGTRVGLEPRVRAVEEDRHRRFFADAMLARLSQWLRIMGIDCAHEPDIADEELVRRSLEERRTILTRDQSLALDWRVPGIYLVASKTPLSQLREVVAEFNLASALDLFSRCSRCNTALVNVLVEQVRNRVPERVLEVQPNIWQCPHCDRLYWEGSHTDHMRRVIDRVLEDVGEAT